MSYEIKPQDTGSDCIVIGFNTTVLGGADNVFLYGDNLLSDVPNDMQVGDTLFGQEIPTTVRSLLKQSPKDVGWILKSLCRHLDGMRATSEIR